MTVSITFGALTQAAQGDYPVTGASIASGDPNGHFQIASGFLQVSTAGASAHLNAGPYTLELDDGSTVCVGVIENAYHVGKSSDWGGASGVGKIAASTLAGKSIYIRPGVRCASNTTAGSAPGECLRRGNYWSATNSAPLTIIGEGVGTVDSPSGLSGFSDTFYLNNSQYIHFQNILFTVPATTTDYGILIASSTATLPASDIWIDQCVVLGVNTFDPTMNGADDAAFYNDGVSHFGNGKGIATNGVNVSNVKITGCAVRSAWWGIAVADNAVQTGAGNFVTNVSPTVVGNYVDLFFELGIRVGVGLNTSSNNLVTDNVLSRCVSNPADFSRHYHADVILFDGNQTSCVSDVNFICDRNIIIRGDSRGYGCPIAWRDLDLSTGPYYFVGSIIGNVVCAGWAEGSLICQNAKNIVCKNNSCILQDGDGTSPTSGLYSNSASVHYSVQIGATPGSGSDTSDGVHTVDRNICEYVQAAGTLHYGTNNLENSVSGYAFDTILVGPAFSPTLRSDVLSELAMLSGGHADLGTPPNIGAIGTGAINFASDNPSDTFGSNDVS